jgi:hypothetical protein
MKRGVLDSMPLTPTQALQAVKDHSLAVERAGDGWRAQTQERTRLHKGTRPTYEEAVEAALQTMGDVARAQARTDKGRLFDLLGTGRVRFEYREETVPVPGDPLPAKVPRFDIYSSTNLRIVIGAASLHEAVLTAEALGAFSILGAPAIPGGAR